MNHYQNLKAQLNSTNTNLSFNKTFELDGLIFPSLAVKKLLNSFPENISVSASILEGNLRVQWPAGYAIVYAIKKATNESAK